MQSTSSDAIFSKVISAVEQTLFVEGSRLLPETKLVDDLHLGRFGRIRLALYLEETFDVEISDDAVDCFDTVGDIALYMSQWSLENRDAAAPSWLNA